MLPSASRLRRNSSFSKVYARGRSYATDLVVVYALPNKEDVTRVGFSVSKKLGGSVKRSRVKRVLSEAVRQYLSQLAPGYDLVVVARRRAAEASFWDVSAALRALLQKLEVLRAGK